MISRTYRWSALVPIGSNPLILLDVFQVLFVAGGIAMSALLAAQWYFAGSISMANAREAFLLALLLNLLFLLFFAGGVFLVLKNRYVALYRIDEREIYSENIRPARFTPPEESFFFMSRAVLLTSPVEVGGSTVRKVYWREVRRIEELKEIGVLLLKGRRGTLLRLYCPGKETYSDVLALCRSILTEAHEKGGIEKN